MTKRTVGIKVIASPHPPGIAVVPVVPFPATDTERARAAEEASKVALLLRRPSQAQGALLRHLAETSPEGSYVVSTAKWIDTILKATKSLNEADMTQLFIFDWNERAISPRDLRRKLLAVLKSSNRL